LRVGYAAPEAGLAPVWVAQERGLFRQYGLDVDLVFLSSARTDQAVIAGDAPIGFGANIIASRLGGADIVGIAGVVNRISFTLFTQPGIGSPDDLRGKILLTSSPGAVGTSAMLLALRHFGLEAQRDVSIQPTQGIAEKLALMTQGLGDATLFSPPTDLKAAEAGLKPLMNLADLDLPLMQTAVGTSRAYARDHEEEINRFLRAYIAAVALARQDAEATKAIIGQYTQSEDSAMLDYAYRYYQPIWGRPDFRVPPAAVQSILSVLDVPGAATAQPGDFIDDHFVDAVDRSGFIRQVGAAD
jgi:NitT/TauT family transport system substrate-binding protein